MERVVLVGWREWGRLELDTLHVFQAFQPRTLTRREQLEATLQIAATE